MKSKYVMLIGLVALSLLVATSVALASANSSKPATTFPEMVRQATAQFKDVGGRRPAMSCSTAASAGRKKGRWASTLPMAAWSATVSWTQ